jgi:hypothetical protein
MFALLRLFEKDLDTDKSGDSHPDMKKFLDLSTQKFLSPTPQTKQLFGYPLDQHLNLKYPLIQLAALIDWAVIDKTFSGHFVSDRVRPA